MLPSPQLPPSRSAPGSLGLCSPPSTQPPAALRSPAPIPTSLFLLLALLLGPLPPTHANPSTPAPIKLATTRHGDRATLTHTATAAAITITSATGIGTATISRAGKAWPATITLGLQLRGLESLVIDDGTQRLEISVPSHGDRPTLQSLTVDGVTGQLEPDHPLWIHVQALDAAGDPSDTPVTFLLTIPPQLLTHASLSLSWIDFYRN